MDERAQAEAFLRGDQSSFVMLHRAHSPALYAFISRLLGRHRQEAPDALQEVWLRAARDLPRFRWQSSLRTWLFGIALNRCREIVRLASRTAPGEDLDESVEPLPLATRIDLERALERLSLRYREVLVLHDIHQHTHEEIAVLLGIDSGTSKSNLSRARAVLRELLADHGATHGA